MRAAVWILLIASACAKGDAGYNTDAAPGGDALPIVDAPVTGTCVSGATCQTATMMGSLSGDTGGMKTANGYQAAWLRVRVTEDNNGLSGVKLSFTARLTSPPSANYDMFVYVNTGADQVECNTPTGTPTKTGASEELRVEWGEGSIPNGVSDSRDVSIEVRPVSNQCAPTANWQLVVTGHT